MWIAVLIGWNPTPLPLNGLIYESWERSWSAKIDISLCPLVWRKPRNMLQLMNNFCVYYLFSLRLQSFQSRPTRREYGRLKVTFIQGEKNGENYLVLEIYIFLLVISEKIGQKTLLVFVFFATSAWNFTADKSRKQQFCLKYPLKKWSFAISGPLKKNMHSLYSLS